MQDILKELRAALEREPRVHVHQNDIRTDLSEGALVIEGQVADIAAKKLVLGLAGDLAPNGVQDHLRLITTEPAGDGAIRDRVCDALAAEPSLKTCGIHVWVKGAEETVRDIPSESDSAIHLFVERGVITLDGQVPSLSHKRLAGVLAWWVAGCRDVVNELAVSPPEQDNDDEIIEAVRLVLERDSQLPAEQVRIFSRNRVVTLNGLMSSETEKRRAEMDAWYVHGVGNVINRIEVRH